MKQEDKEQKYTLELDDIELHILTGAIQMMLKAPQEALKEDNIPAKVAISGILVQCALVKMQKQIDAYIGDDCSSDISKGLDDACDGNAPDDFPYILGRSGLC